MSRHRNVKHLVDEDYHDYEDDYYDDEYDDYDDGYTGGSQSHQQQVSNNKQKQQQAKNKKQQQSQSQSQTKKKAPATPTNTKASSGGGAKTPLSSSAAKKTPVASVVARKTPPPPATTPGTTTISSTITTPRRRSTGGLMTSATALSPQPPPPLPAVLMMTSTASTSNNNEDSTTTTTNKVPLTVVVLGHVDAGKSTVTGHLLYGGSGANNNGKLSSPSRKAPVNYAWLLDEDEQERQHGVTMDIATKQLDDRICQNFQIVLQDAPGHADYVPAMITGTAAADAALLTIDATDLHTTIGMGKGQLREHVFLARGLGVNQILVLLNKMDVVGWDNKDAYMQMESEIKEFLIKQVGYPSGRVRCIPVSGLTGTNIFPRNRTNDDDDDDEDTKLLRQWYKGPTLVEALDGFEPPIQQQQKLLEKPARVIISDVLDGSGNGMAVRAKVVSGWIKQGENLTVLPVGDETSITKASSLHARDEQTADRRQYCVAGELIDCTLTNIDWQRISPGSILARPNNRPPLASRCRAKVFCLDSLAIPLIRGAQVIFHMHHLDIPCHFSVLIRTLKADGTTTLKERPRALTRNSTAIVELQLAVPVCVEPFSECRALGRFVLRRSGDSIAVGRIEEVLATSK